MIALLRLLVLRYMVTKPTRFFLTILAASVGVALFVSIRLVNQSTSDFFAETIASMSGRAVLSIAGQDGGFAEEVLETVRQVSGVRSAAPLITVHASYYHEDGTSETLQILGIDLLKEANVRVYKTQDEQILDDPLVFLNQEDSIIVTQTFANAHHLTLESKLRLAGASGPRTFVVRGVLTPEGPARAYGGAIAFMDIDAARFQFGRENRTDRIDIVAEQGQDVRDLQSRLARTLGPVYRVGDPNEQTEAFRRMISSVQSVLQFVGSLSLLVGLFVVANTLSYSVFQRTKEFALLRAIGATRGIVLTVVLVESVALGLISSVTGLVAGRWSATWLVGMVSRSLSQGFHEPVRASSITLGAGGVWLSIGAGTGLAVLAALFPAVRAMRVEPLAAFRSTVATGTKQEGTRSAVAGIGAMLLGYLVLDSLLRSRYHFQHSHGVAAICAVVGSVCVTPWLFRLFLRGGRALAVRVTGTSWALVVRLACDNLLRSPRRTNTNVIALTVGLLVFIISFIVQNSVKQASVRWMQDALPYDIHVSVGQSASADAQPFRGEVLEKINTIQGVEIVDGVGARATRALKMHHKGHEIGVRARDAPSLAHGTTLTTVDRPSAEVARDLFFGATPAVAVSETFASKFGHKSGDDLELMTPTGPLRVKIVGIVVSFSSPEGVVVMSRTLYKEHWHDDLVSFAGVHVLTGEHAERVREKIDALVGQEYGLTALLTQEVRAQGMAAVDEAFAHAGGTRAAALIAAMLGLINTLLISILERHREFGVLRAVGMSRGQLAGMVVIESIVQGLLSALIAMLVAVYVCGVWAVKVFGMMIGYPIGFAVSASLFLATGFVGLGVSAIAGWIASRRAARLEIVTALGSE